MNPDSRRPISKRPSGRSNFWQIALAIILVFLLLGELWRRIGQASDLRALQDQVAAQVTALASQSSQLSTSLADAQSDQAVAAWARSQAKMAKPGEVLVQPVTPVGATAPQPTPTPQPPSSANWRIWWQWLWGPD
ncbi:MAG: hypothetical protein ABSG98_03335 [Anaerolineales bacterium]|jgi:cell division protein FtsB